MSKYRFSSRAAMKAAGCDNHHPRFHEEETNDSGVRYTRYICMNCGWCGEFRTSPKKVKEAA